MTRINLLPKELQNAARTPVVLFATIIAGMALTLVAICVYGYLWFNSIVIKERLERKRDEVTQLQQNAAEVDSLLDDIADYKEREKAIISIKTNRILWSRNLEELARITPAFIWIVRLEMREYDPSEYKWEPGVEQAGGYMRLLCFSSGSEVENMTVFRQRLKSSDDFFLHFLKDNIKPANFHSNFINISRPEWKFVLLPGYRDPENIRFTVRLDLKPLVEQSGTSA